LRKAPQSAVKYPCLVVSDNVNEPADVLTISDFRRVREKLKKGLKKGTGLEVTVAQARKMDATSVGRWFQSVRDLHSFCRSSRCQLVLSSGATSMHEMVSGQCLDAVMRHCGIDPHRHWLEMNGWLEARLTRRMSI
jgi:hypothetical protein